MSEWPKSYVYFARGTQSRLIKIGKSECPVNRMRALESEYKEPMKVIFVIGGNIRAEQEYHRRFKDCRERITAADTNECPDCGRIDCHINH